MSKLGCKCGHTIVDQEDSLSHKAQLIPDKCFDEFFDRIELAIKELIEATKNGKREDWIKKNFSVPPYPMDLREEQMIDDIFGNYYFDLSKDVLQCEKCGRIYVEKENNRFISFLPEDDNWKDILSKKGANLENNA